MCNRFPFDYKNLVGYLIVVAIEFRITIVMLRFVACLTCTTLGAYITGVSLSKDVNGDLFVIDESVKINQPSVITLKQLSEFVRAHSNGKRLLETYSAVYENILTILFTWSALTICINMLMIEMEIVELFSFHSNERLPYHAL